MLKCQCLPDIGGGRRAAEHDTELGRRELSDLWTAVTADNDATLAAFPTAAAAASRAGTGVVAVGKDLDMLEESHLDPVGLRTMRGGRRE